LNPNNQQEVFEDEKEIFSRLIESLLVFNDEVILIYGGVSIFYSFYFLPDSKKSM